ncbi:hypothetical protein [Marinobacterium aestuariivivens]|uniref:Lipoprotein SmpA/OmlA domain-containing protein n=1 Tax=Marinobacterium aestuariivivens TaxID=1698799 RepID=A0ABW2A7V8_9GAMM
MFIALVLTGCVFIPSSSEDPFDANELKRLVAGRASPKEVRKALGDPVGVFEDKSFYFHEYRKAGHLIGYYGFGVTDAVHYESHMVAVHFNDDREAEAFELKTWDASSKPNFCFKYEICFEGTSWLSPLTPPGDDAEAKRFPVDSGTCTLYYYRESPWIANHNPFQIRIYLNRHLAGVTHGKGGYLMWRLQPYRYNLRANSHAPAYMNMRYSFECNAGEIHFIRHIVPLTSRGHLELSEVDVAAGKKAIAERKRLLDVYVPPKLRPRRYYHFR